VNEHEAAAASERVAHSGAVSSSEQAKVAIFFPSVLHAKIKTQKAAFA
jgi:hypothetical protein